MGWWSNFKKKVKKAVKKYIVNPIKKVVKKVKEVIFGKPPSMDSSKFEEPTFAEQGAQGILIQKTGSNSPIPVIYGETRTGGIQVFVKTSGTDNVDLHMAIAICEGPIESVTHLYFDDVLAATNNNSSGDSDSWSIASPWSGKVTVNFRTGTDSQSKISTLGTQMGNDPRFRGIAYCYIRLNYDKDKWKNGVPSISFQVKGKKVPSTSDGTSLSYTDNPANCMLDYLTNVRYGKGIPVSQIDLPSFASAATHFSNESFHCRGNLFTGVNMYDNIIDLCSACTSSLTFGNKYQLIPEKTGSSVMTLDKTNTVGNVEYLLADKKSLINTMKIKFMDQDTEYKDNIKVLDNSTLKTQDNGNVLLRELYLPFTKTSALATKIGTQMINQSRQSHMISLTTTIAGLKLSVGDIVQVTNETFGITNKKFRVKETTLQHAGEIDLILAEYSDSIYAGSIITNARDDDND
jgi:hypothetical protein